MFEVVTFYITDPSIYSESVFFEITFKYRYRPKLKILRSLYNYTLSATIFDFPQSPFVHDLSE